jgi:hypothetical protein
MVNLTPLRSFVGDAADWFEAGPGAFVLCCQPQVFATLDFTGSRRAIACTTEGRWAFAWKGRALGARASIVDADSGAVIGECESERPTRARLVCADGGEFALLPNFLLTVWTWRSADGREILTLRRKVPGASLQLLLASDRFRETSLLGCLGWYLLAQWWTPELE